MLDFVLYWLSVLVTGLALLFVVAIWAIIIAVIVLEVRGLLKDKESSDEE